MNNMETSIRSKKLRNILEQTIQDLIELEIAESDLELAKNELADDPTNKHLQNEHWKSNDDFETAKQVIESAQKTLKKLADMKIITTKQWVEKLKS